MNQHISKSRKWTV